MFNCRTLINTPQLNVVDALPCIYGLKPWPTFISPYQGCIPPPTAAIYQFSSWFGEQGLFFMSSPGTQRAPWICFSMGPSKFAVCKHRNGLQPTAKLQPALKRGKQITHMCGTCNFLTEKLALTFCKTVRGSFV